MKRNILALSSIFFAMFFLVGCGSDDSGTPAKMVGWAVGESVNGFGTILHTDNGGKTWIRQGDSTQISDSDFSDVCILDPQTVLVSGSVGPDGTIGLYKSHDGGKNWARITFESLDKVNYNGIFALGKEHVWIVGDSGTIYRSDDQGASWVRINVPAEYQTDIFLRVAARDVNDVWVVGDKHVSDDYPIMIHTTDGGKTWERLNPVKDLQIEGAERGHFLAIKLFGDSVWAAGGFGKFVIRSGDKGATWALIKSGADADANDIYVLSENEAYVVEDYNGIYHTADAGKNWNDYSFITGNWYLGIAVLKNKNIWVVGSPGAGLSHSAIIYSHDSGITWQRQTAQVLEDTYVALYKIRFSFQ